MAKLIIMLDGAPVKEHPLEKERTTIGRRPGNDIQLEDPTVSGEHAAVLLLQQAYIEDLNSTNGTFLGGVKVKKRALANGDVIRIGRHELKFIEKNASDFVETVVIPAASPRASGAAKPAAARIAYLDGPQAGQKVPLSKAYTTVGSPGVQVAIIARRAQGYVLMPVSGGGPRQSPLKLNNQAVGAESRALKPGDVIEVAALRMEFQQD